ncbi:MAG: 5-oxoprolinase subunit PxpB [Beijerinckiaceae bacterium]|nr:5-oxoprolinase subunit PxpB [Beijerinckiaceae bacterium]
MLDYELKNAGDTALVVEFGEQVDRNISSRVLALADAIRTLNTPGVVELIPTFRSLMIRYEPLLIAPDDLNAVVARSLALAARSDRPRRSWIVPVCFEDAFALDAESVAEFSGLSRDGVVQALCSPVYHVYMLGFLPGQPYLGDLPPAFDMPRRPSPRAAIPAGSVGIAKRLVCIYPAQTPCGWHIVGRCDARLWRGESPLLQAGDEVRFSAVPAHRLADAYEAPMHDEMAL